MAARIRSHQFSNSGRRTYPWHQWTDGSIWQITQGEDFSLAVEQMRKYLHSYAHVNGVTVRTTVTDDAIVFQFPQPDRPKKKVRVKKQR